MMTAPRSDPVGWVRGGTAWRTAARWIAGIGWLLWLAMQVIAKDPFPPDISLSQYGLGGAGFAFSLWAIGLGVTPLLLLRYRPVGGPARPVVALAFVAAVLTGLVRTDEGGLQLSLAAKVHQVTAVVALVLLPVGVLFAMTTAARRWWWLAVGISVSTAVVALLVLFAAAGIDTIGIGVPASWALWEGMVAALEMLLVSVYAATVTTVGHGVARPDLIPPVQTTGH